MLDNQDGCLSEATLPIPSSFQCPITQEVMAHPVVTVDGQAYEKNAIEAWFRRGHRTSPLTGATLPSLVLADDKPLQRAIEEYMRLRPEMERLVLDHLSLEKAAQTLEGELSEKARLLQSASRHCDMDPPVRLGVANSGYPPEFTALCTQSHAESPLLPHLAAAPPSRCMIDFAGHSQYVRCITGLGADHVASGSLDCTAKVWSTIGGCCVQTLTGHTDGVLSIAPIVNKGLAMQLATGSKDNTLKVWGRRSGLRQWVCVSTFEGHQDAVAALATLDDDSIVSGSFDHSVKIWKLATGECSATLSGGPSNGEIDRNSVQSIATFNSNYIAVGSSSKYVHIWDATEGQRIATLKGHHGSIQGVAVLAPGIVASCSSDRSIRVWDVGSGHTITVLEGHTDDVNTIACLGSGNLISGSSDETVRIWDMKICGLLATLQGHSDSVFGVASLGNNQALSCSDDRLIKLWEP
jgi:WD40 repeat protein